MKTVYKSTDDVIFDSEKKCIDYEEELKCYENQKKEVDLEYDILLKDLISSDQYQGAYNDIDWFLVIGKLSNVNNYYLTEQLFTFLKKIKSLKILKRRLEGMKNE